jgi:hypothetical protein
VFFPRRLTTGLCLAALLSGGAVVSAAPAHAAKDRLAIGDSVMLGAAEELRSLGFRVDAQESRQSYKGPSLLRKQGSALPTNVVVHLGTNGTFPVDVCKKIVKIAGPSRRVFFVNVHVPRSWMKSNNQALKACDEAFAADRVHVIDWNGLVSRHPAWLYSDHTHLKPAGQQGFARLVKTEVDTAVARARAAALSGASGSGHAGLQE